MGCSTVRYRRRAAGSRTSGLALATALVAAVLLPGAALAQALIQRLPAPAEGTLLIDLDYGSVSVVAHAAPEVVVEARARGLGSSAFRFELTRGRDATDAERTAAEEEAVLVLTGRAQQWMAWLANPPRVDVLAKIPPGFAVEIQTADGAVHVASVSGAIVRTDNAPIRVSDILGPVDVRTGGSVRTDRSVKGTPVASGRIDAVRVRGNVHAETGGSRIHLSGVGGDVEAHADGGAIEIDGVGGHVVAATRGAAILARFTTAPTGSFETPDGWIEIAFPASAGADLDARALGGCVHIERQPVGGRERQGAAAAALVAPVDCESSCGAESGRVVGPINGGGPPLELRAERGDIRLQTL